MIIKSVKHKGDTVSLKTSEGSLSFHCENELALSELEGFSVETLEDVLKLPHELHYPLLQLHEKQWKLIKDTKKIPRPLTVVLRKEKGIKEFMLVSYDAKSFSDAFSANEKISKVFYKKLSKEGFSVKKGAVKDDVDDREILLLLKESISEVDDDYAFTVHIGLGVYSHEGGKYVYSSKSLEEKDHVDFLADLVKHYGVSYLEAPFYETHLKSYEALKKKVFKNCLVSYSSKIQEFTVALFEKVFSAALLNYVSFVDLKENLDSFLEHNIVTVVDTSLENVNAVLGLEIVLAKFDLEGSKDLVKYLKKAEVSLREGN